MEQLNSVHHIAIPVADLARSVAWYTSSFSCRVVLLSQTHAVLEFANVKLILTLPSQEPAHIAFLHSGAETFGEMRLRPDGWISTFVSDPTGNIIELLGAENSW